MTNLTKDFKKLYAGKGTANGGLMLALEPQFLKLDEIDEIPIDTDFELEWTCSSKVGLVDVEIYLLNYLVNSYTDIDAQDKSATIKVEEGDAVMVGGTLRIVIKDKLGILEDEIEVEVIEGTTYVFPKMEIKQSWISYRSIRILCMAIDPDTYAFAFYSNEDGNVYYYSNGIDTVTGEESTKFNLLANNGMVLYNGYLYSIVGSDCVRTTQTGGGKTTLFSIDSWFNRCGMGCDGEYLYFMKYGTGEIRRWSLTTNTKDTSYELHLDTTNFTNNTDSRMSFCNGVFIVSHTETYSSSWSSVEIGFFNKDGTFIKSGVVKTSVGYNMYQAPNCTAVYSPIDNRVYFSHWGQQFKFFALKQEGED